MPLGRLSWCLYDKVSQGNNCAASETDTSVILDYKMRIINSESEFDQHHILQINLE